MPTYAPTNGLNLVAITGAGILAWYLYQIASRKKESIRYKIKRTIVALIVYVGGGNYPGAGATPAYGSCAHKRARWNGLRMAADKAPEARPAHSNGCSAPGHCERFDQQGVEMERHKAPH